MATESMPAANPLGALPSVGAVVAGKYRIERMIAEGGMGVVYEATHLHLDELVAIKFLRADFLGAGDTEVAGRFIREARASAKIRSEHVTRVHDVGTLENGAPYIVMERLHGEDLESLVEKTGTLPIELGVDYILQACEALAEAHAIGMVHRDLKPANLYLTHRADGSSCVKVLDFGISKFKDGAVDNITKTSAVMGSPRYMSPEQMRSSRDVDPRADIWAIGIILYELFAGTVPFDGESMPQICAAILQDEPKSLRMLRPDLPPALEIVVSRCLQKKAADRYASIVPLALELSYFGTVNARASAERIARVLKNSGPELALSLPPPNVTSASDSGRLPSIRVRANASGNSATALEWTGTELAPVPKRKKTIFILGGLAFLLIGITAATTTVVLHNRNLAAAHEQPQVHDTTMPAVKPDVSAVAATTTTSPIPNSTSAPAVTTPVDTTTPVAVTTTTQAAAPKSPGKKGNSASRPAPSHPSTSAAQSTPATPPPTPPATTKPATGGDMWDERK
jgi:serine/threonine-protein kinase